MGKGRNCKKIQKEKPHLIIYIVILIEFIELHGDRNFKDDKAIVCGLGKIDNQNFTIIAEQKGRTTKRKYRKKFWYAKPRKL